MKKFVVTTAVALSEEKREAYRKKLAEQLGVDETAVVVMPTWANLTVVDFPEVAKRTHSVLAIEAEKK